MTEREKTDEKFRKTSNRMQYKAEKLNAPPFCRIYVRIETASFNPPPLLLFVFFCTKDKHSTYNDEWWWCLVSMSLHIIFKPLNMNQNGAFFSRQSFNGCMFDVFKEPPHLFNWLFCLRPTDFTFQHEWRTQRSFIRSIHYNFNCRAPVLF